MSNKAFHNLFCNPQKSIYTSSGSFDSKSRGCQLFFTLINGIYKNFTTSLRNDWQPMLFESKIPERCENSFVDYRIT